MKALLWTSMFIGWSLALYWRIKAHRAKDDLRWLRAAYYDLVNDRLALGKRVDKP